MLEIKYKKINELKPYKNNPRINKQAIEPVAKSIKEFGFRNPIIIDKDNVIVAGHTRYEASKLLNIKEVPTLDCEGLTKEQIRAFRIIDNKTQEYAKWNKELLKLELDDIKLDLSDFDLCIESTDKIIEDDVEIKLPEKPKSKLGEIYKLGNHLLLCGDSTNLEHLKELVKKSKNNFTVSGGVKLVITDPPYNVNIGEKASLSKNGKYGFSDKKILNDHMSNKDFYLFLEKVFKNMESIIECGASFYIFHASSTVYEFEKALKSAGLQTRQQLMWLKDFFVLSRQDYHWIHEPILYGWKEGKSHYFVEDRTMDTTFKNYDNLENLSKRELLEILNKIKEQTQTTVIKEDRPKKSEEHPTMKPIKLLAKLIQNSSKPGDTVLDLFGGSGSTLIACEQTNRKCLMIEYDPKYVDVIINRWEQFTKQKVVKMSA